MGEEKPNQHISIEKNVAIPMRDGVILNPLDHYIMALLRASLVLNNRDEFCMKYIEANDAGKFNIKAVLEAKD